MRTAQAARAAAACLIVFLAGCSNYAPQGFWEVSKVKVDLEAKNFQVRKLGAQGSASCPYLFGIPFGSRVIGIPMGGPGAQNLQHKSMEILHQTWDGQGSCFLHNINVEWNTYGIPCIWITHQNTITADIYEFDREYVDYARR